MSSIVLASGSPRRKKLLRKINLNFTIHESNAPEKYNPNDSPTDIVQTLALRKAEDVASHYKQSLIIGADTIVAFNNSILGKPDTKAEAREMLASMSGNAHWVLTGVALVKVGKNQNNFTRLTFCEQTKVIFSQLEDQEIANYVEKGNPMDKAGSYGIQDRWGALFVEGIHGDYYNVVGFPLHTFYQKMKQFAPEYLSKNNCRQ